MGASQGRDPFALCLPTRTPSPQVRGHVSISLPRLSWGGGSPAAHRGCANTPTRSGAIGHEPGGGPCPPWWPSLPGSAQRWRWPRRRELLKHCHGNGDNGRCQGEQGGQELRQAELAGEMPPAALLCARAALGGPAWGLSHDGPCPSPVTTQRGASASSRRAKPSAPLAPATEPEVAPGNT